MTIEKLDVLISPYLPPATRVEVGHLLADLRQLHQEHAHARSTLAAVMGADPHETLPRLCGMLVMGALAEETQVIISPGVITDTGPKQK